MDALAENNNLKMLVARIANNLDAEEGRLWAIEAARNFQPRGPMVKTSGFELENLGSLKNEEALAGAICMVLQENPTAIVLGPVTSVAIEGEFNLVEAIERGLIGAGLAIIRVKQVRL